MSPLFEQRFMGVTAHEIAHMWFGDYVTMAWWNDLWLNESFASWLASAIVAELRPDWPPRRLALAPAHAGDRVRPPASRRGASASP